MLKKTRNNRNFTSGLERSVKRLGQKMIKKIIELGGKKENIVVAIGPSIGQCCYDVDDERYYQFVEEFNGYTDKIFTVTMVNFILIYHF